MLVAIRITAERDLILGNMMGGDLVEGNIADVAKEDAQAKLLCVDGALRKPLRLTIQ